MQKLFEMYAVRDDPNDPETPSMEEMVPQVMEAMSEVLDDMIQRGIIPAPDNVHVSCFHDEPCPGVAEKDFGICDCGTVRFEIYIATDADVALNMAGGSTRPYGLVSSDDFKAKGDMN